MEPIKNEEGSQPRTYFTSAMYTSMQNDVEKIRDMARAIKATEIDETAQEVLRTMKLFLIDPEKTQKPLSRDNRIFSEVDVGPDRTDKGLIPERAEKEARA